MREITNEELKKDGELLLNIIIPSSPATKKNSNRVVRVKGFIKVLPSERFIKYQSFCGTYLKNIKPKNSFDFGISIKIRVATDKWIVPDETNIQQALGDILQHWKIITDDKWIHWTSNSPNISKEEHWFIGVDKTNPRIEIEIRRFRHPLEKYREDKELKESKKLQKNNLS